MAVIFFDGVTIIDESLVVYDEVGWKLDNFHVATSLLILLTDFSNIFIKHGLYGYLALCFIEDAMLWKLHFDDIKFCLLYFSWNFFIVL
jgi:hypothetical protein